MFPRLLAIALPAFLTAVADAREPIPYQVEFPNFDTSDDWETYWREARDRRIDQLRVEAAALPQRSEVRRDVNLMLRAAQRSRPNVLNLRKHVAEAQIGETVWMEALPDVTKDGERLDVVSQNRTVVTRVVTASEFVAAVSYDTIEVDRDAVGIQRRALGFILNGIDLPTDFLALQVSTEMRVTRTAPCVFRGFETTGLTDGDVVSYEGLFTIVGETGDMKIVEPYGPEQDRRYWRSQRGGFEELDDEGNWRETTPNGTLLSFIEAERTWEYVQLHRNNGDVVVRLYDDRAIVKLGRDAEFEEFYRGNWAEPNE